MIYSGLCFTCGRSAHKGRCHAHALTRKVIPEVMYPPEASVTALRKPEQVKNLFEPVDAIVELLEKQLVDAKSGKLRAILIARVEHDDLIQGGEVHHDWCGAQGTMWVMDRALNRLRWHWDQHVNKE